MTGAIVESKPGEFVSSLTSTAVFGAIPSTLDPLCGKSASGSCVSTSRTATCRNPPGWITAFTNRWICSRLKIRGRVVRSPGDPSIIASTLAALVVGFQVNLRRHARQIEKARVLISLNPSRLRLATPVLTLPPST